jgi:hypothetical protein
MTALLIVLALVLVDAVEHRCHLIADYLMPPSRRG